MSSPKDPGFDAFFQAVTAAPEFHRIIKKDSPDELAKALQDMDATIAKASDMVGAFHTTFGTEEAKKEGNALKTSGPDTSVPGSSPQDPLSQTGNSKDETKKSTIEIRRPVMKDPATWGFLGIAGMEPLKKELMESFITPLRFKFLVEKLKKEQNSEEENIEDSEKKPKKESTPEDEKNKLYVELHAAYEKFKITIPTGLFFYGPPGTGKTFITRKLAEELGAGMIEKSVGEFGSSYLHETSRNIRDFFREAKEASQEGPIILFLDEIDSLVSKRSDRVDANKAEEISQFLQEFNALGEAQNLIVIAASNRPDHLDPAILRTGRLDKKVYIGPPDITARRELFQMYIERSGRPHSKLNYDTLATLTDGYVASDIEAICDEVARDASRSILDMAKTLESDKYDAGKIRAALDDHKITMTLLIAAIADTPSSLKMVDMSIYEEWIKQVS